jgi:uncharacterized protein (TIRG00374 family)
MTLQLEATSTPVATTSRKRTIALRMAVGLGAGAISSLIFLQLIDFGSVAKRLEHLNVGFAILCAALFLGAYAVRALRWRVFLAPDKVGAARVIGIYYVATFLNWALPVQGGEVAKSLMLRRSNQIPISRSLATIAMDKTMDLLPAVVLLSIVPFTSLHLSGAMWALLLFPFAILACLTLLLALASWQPERALTFVSGVLRAILPRSLYDRVEPFVAQFVETLLSLFRKPRLLLVASGYTVVAVVLDALFCYFAFRTVGVTLTWTTALIGYTFYNLAYILPTPPAHIGSNELVGLLVFSTLFGIDRSSVAAMFLFSHPWTGLLMTVTAVVCVRATGMNMRETLRLQSDTESEVEQ